MTRPRLIDQLNKYPQRKLSLISAPAGFGKTSLVSEWVDQLGRDIDDSNEHAANVAWFSLDEGDNDPVRFLAYLVTAVRRMEGIDIPIGQDALNMLDSPQPPPVEDVLIALINDVAAIPEIVILVLDDYHVIESTSVDEALTFLLDHMPSHMHVVIATRDDPRLPLARLRGRGQITELRAADLRFSTTEVGEFLNRVMNLNLLSDDIAALESRTEGWIAGLQLAAISMRGYQDASEFIHSFTGSHRFVLDYLIEEVLQHQMVDTQDRLLQTAILDRLTAPLCDALTGQDDSQATLEMLERANLFIVPLDVERRWYRYHHLFADLLNDRLRQTRPELLSTLHHRASEWFEQNDLADEAIEHALHAEDFERAAQLTTRLADAIWESGDHAKYRLWLERLPVDFVFSKPILCTVVT